MAEYNPGILHWIAEHYTEYLNLPADSEALDNKCDFDMSLDSLGYGHWSGDMDEECLSIFSPLQRVVIRIIFGIEAEVDTDKLTEKAFIQMAQYLNEGGYDKS